MPPTAGRSSIEAQAHGPVGYLRISGVIDETFSPPPLGAFAAHLVIDAGRVQRISSFGVRRWAELVERLPHKVETISIVHAPAPLVDQLGMIANFAGVAEVLSVLAPYECARCGKDRLALIDLTSPTAREAIQARRAVERSCPDCEEPLRFAENPSEYFGYFRARGRPPSVLPVVEHFQRLLQLPDGLESPLPFKLLQDRVTYYQLRGRLMPNLNLRRMLGGLEGLVNFDFARVSGIEPGGKAVVASLLEQAAAVAEVIVSRVPSVLLRGLESAAPVKLASVIVAGQCALCGEVRPHRLPAHAYLQDLKRGALPQPACPVCGGPATLEAAEVTGFLERHAYPSEPAVLKSLEARAFIHLLEEAAATGSPVRLPVNPSAPALCEICGGSHRANKCPTLMSEPAPEPTTDLPRPDPVSPAGAESLLGRVVGNYRLTKVLGAGSSACVYLGEHEIIGSRVAVKILHPHLATDPATVARFTKEARITSAIVHDCVVQVFDILTIEQNLFCIVMEYLDGQTMGQAYEQRIVPYEEAAPLLLQVCDALATAHGHGIVHRDLKPDNVYLLKRAGRTRVKVVDFGIARRAVLSDGEDRTLVGTILGTPSYMSPEQAFSLGVDSRADVYSLGVMMFELATGRLPFEQLSVRGLLNAHRLQAPPRPRSINPLLEPDYEEVILRALAKDPADRYQTMAELGRAIAQIDEENRRVGSALTPPMGSSPAAVKQATAGLSMRRHPRLPVELPVEVELPGNTGSQPRVRERMTMLDISLSGLFLRSQKTIPEVFTRVVLHPLILGAHPLIAEVVRTTRDEDPQTRAVLSGFGVNFIASEHHAEQERTIQTILALSGGAPRLPSVAAETEQFLGRIEAQGRTDYYGLLGLPLHATFPTVRNACSQLARVLASPQLQELSPADLLRVKEGRERLAVAEGVLADPTRRAAYDATRGNFVGIARCLASGLETGALAQLREEFMTARPEQLELIRPLRAGLAPIVAKGELEPLLEGLTVALRLDPLALDLQTQYWEVWRKLKGEPLTGD